MLGGGMGGEVPAAGAGSEIKCSLLA